MKPKPGTNPAQAISFLVSLVVSWGSLAHASQTVFTSDHSGNRTAQVSTSATGVPVLAPQQLTTNGQIGGVIGLSSSVAASSSVTYQWYKSAGLPGVGTAIAGATSSTLLISNAKLSDFTDHVTGANSYYVVATTSGGSVTSDLYTVNLDSTDSGLPDWAHLPYSPVLSPFLSTGSAYSTEVDKTIIQPDGKVLVFGSFDVLSGCPSRGLGRLNADGTNDVTFNPPFRVRNLGDAALQADGKILVIATFLDYPSVSLLRLNADGSVDPTFSTAASVGTTALAVQADQKILIGGNFGIRRLKADGTPDSTFKTGSNLGSASVSPGCLQLDSDGKIYVAGGFDSYDGVSSPGLVRLLATGKRDTTFKVGTGVPANSSVFSLIVRPTGGVIIAGKLNSFNGKAVSDVAVLTSSGAVETTTPLAKSLLTLNASNSLVRALAFQADGKLVIGGTLYVNSSSSLMRFTTAGAVDDYSPSFSNQIDSLSAQPDGKMVVGGSFLPNALVRLNPDGTSDKSLMSATPGGYVGSLAETAEGRILVGGTFDTLNTAAIANFGQINLDGTIDATFHPEAGRVEGQPLVLASGQVLASAPYLHRYNRDGSIDPSFAPDNSINYNGIFAEQADGKIVAAGAGSLVRLTKTGTVDTTFAATCNGDVTAIQLQPDGKILIAGEFDTVNGKAKPYLARLLASGALDSSFNPPIINQKVLSMRLLASGQIVIGGSFTPLGATAVSGLVRLNDTGSLDSAWNPFPAGTPGLGIMAIAALPDGGIMVGGSFDLHLPQGIFSNCLRILSNGQIDPAFNPSPNSTVATILARANGDVYLGGPFSSSVTGPVVSIARYSLASQLTLGQVTYSPTGIVSSTTPLTLVASAQSGQGTITNVNFQVSTDGLNFTTFAVGTEKSSTLWTTTWTPTVTGNYFLRIAALDSLGSSGTSIAVFHQPAQVITFPAIADQNYGVASIPLAATSTSKLPVTYSLVSGPGYFSDPTTLIPTQPGTLVVQANQFGSAKFAPAPSVNQTIKVKKGIQTITFAPLPDRVKGSTPFTLSATSSAGNVFGNYPITYTVTGSAKLSGGNTVTLTGVGAVKVVARQAGDTFYGAAAVTRTFNVVAPTTFAQWQTKHGVSGLSSATPLGDGVPSLLKYVYDIDPSKSMSVADRAILPKLEIGEVAGNPATMILTYRKSSFIDGVTINLQTSADLKTWTTVLPDNEIVISDDALGQDTITATVNLSGNLANKGFIRLNVKGVISGEGTVVVSTVPLGFFRNYFQSNLSGAPVISYVSFPLTPEPVYVGAASAVTSTTIRVADSPAPWKASELATAVRPYFVKFLSGPETGRVVKVTANSTNTLTLDTADNMGQTTALNLSGFAVTAGNSFEVFAGDTLGSKLGLNTVDSPLLLTGGTSATADTVAVYKVSTAAWVPYYFDTALGYWRLKSSTSNANNTVIYPYIPIQVTRTPTDFSTTYYLNEGRVAEVPHLIKTPGGNKVVYDSTGYPVDLKLNELVFGSNWVKGSKSALADTISVWDSFQGSATAYYQTTTSTWTVDNSPFDYGDFPIASDTGLALRKHASVSGAASFLKLALPYSLK